MDTNTIIDLLTVYLEQQKATVNYVENRANRNLPCIVINFNYYTVRAEIRIYNPQFILVRRLDNYSKMCDTISSVRNEIDSICNQYSQDFV
jgi:hypothetical protein